MKTIENGALKTGHDAWAKGDRIDTAIAVALIMLVLLILLESPFSPMGNLATNCDSAIFSYIGSMMTRGFTPYIDIRDNKGPLIYILNWIGHLAAGYRGIFYVEYVFMSAAIIICYLTLKKIFLSRLPAFFGTCYTFLLIPPLFWNGNLTEEYALPFVFISMYLFVVNLLDEKNSKPWHTAVVGGCFALSIMLKASLFGTFLGFSLVIAGRELYKRRYISLLRDILGFMLGVCIAIAPVAFYLWLKGALGACLRMGYYEPSWYFGPATLQQKIAVIDNLFGYLSSSFGYALIVTYFTCSTVYYFVAKPGNQRLKAIILPVNTSMLINLLLFSMSNLMFSHYTMMFLPLIAFPAGLFFYLLSGLLSSSSHEFYRSRKTIVAACVILLLLFSLESIKIAKKHIYINAINVHPYMPLKDWVTKRSIADDPIYILDGYMYYYLLDRPISNKYIFMLYGLWNYPIEKKIEELDDLLGELKRKKPKLILYTDETWAKYDKLGYYDMSRYQRFIRDNYNETEMFLGFHTWVRKPEVAI